jgi:serine/threonine-protein kinase RsbT
MAIAMVRKVCLELGLGQVQASKLQTAASELGRNILKYANRGDMVLRRHLHPQSRLELVVSDEGPGIENVENALADHFSSSGTLGLGLPGVKRLMDGFDLKSTPGKGTTVRCLLRI